MSLKYITLTVGIAVAALPLITISTAMAQLNNKPFSFKNSPNGIGMSQGGKQAIINEKLFGSTPDNLHRGYDGQLLNVTQGPGRSAIVFQNGTNNVIPGYKGSDFRGNSDLMNAGIFNAYFGPYHESNSFTGYSYAQYNTAAIIGNWTTNVVAGTSLAPYYGNNSIDVWTSYVYTLNYNDAGR